MSLHTVNVAVGPSVPQGVLVPPVTAASSPPDVWMSCLESVDKRNADLVRGWKEEVDSSMVFAGLFSAMLTAFLIESYKSLKEDPGDVTIALLRQISVEMASFHVTGGFINATAQPNSHHTPIFVKTSSSVRINALWFCSLILSLTSASGGIHAKGWLRTFSRKTSALPHNAARIQEFRYQSFSEWRAPHLISLLPSLLAISVLLFIAGVIDLLWTLDTIVAAIVSALAAVTFLPLMAIPVLPMLYETCPFSSSVTWLVHFISRSTHLRIRAKLALLSDFFSNRQRFWSRLNTRKEARRLHRLSILPFSPAEYFPFLRCRIFENLNIFLDTLGLDIWFPLRSRQVWKRFRTWDRRESEVVQHNIDYLDTKLLAAVDSTRMNNTILESIREHLPSVSYPVSRDALYLILTNRSRNVVDGIPKWTTAGDQHRIILAHMAVDVMHRICVEERGDRDLDQMLRVVDAFCDSIPRDSTNPKIKDLYNRIFNSLACDVLPLSHTTARIKQAACDLMLQLLTSAPTIFELGTPVIQHVIAYTETTAFDAGFFTGFKIIMCSLGHNYDPSLAPSVATLFTRYTNGITSANRLFNTTSLGYTTLDVVPTFVRAHPDVVSAELLSRLHRFAIEVENQLNGPPSGVNIAQSQARPYSELLYELLHEIHGIEL